VAKTLDLTNYIPTIDARRQVQKISLDASSKSVRGPPRNNSQKLADILKLWQILYKETYNIPNLLKVLDTLGFRDMYERERIMSGLTLSHQQIEQLVVAQNNSRPVSARSEYLVPPRSKLASQYFSLPNSPRYTPRNSRPASQIWNLEERGTVNNFKTKDQGVFKTLYRPSQSKSTKLLEETKESTLEKDYRKSCKEESARKDPKIEISPPCNDTSILRKENICKIPDRRYSSAIEYRWEENYSVESNYEKWSNQRKQSNSHILKKGIIWYGDKQPVSRDKYFDNLISVIEEASNSLQV